MGVLPGAWPACLYPVVGCPRCPLPTLQYSVAAGADWGGTAQLPACLVGPIPTVCVALAVHGVANFMAAAAAVTAVALGSFGLSTVYCMVVSLVAVLDLKLGISNSGWDLDMREGPALSAGCPGPAACRLG